MRTGAHAKYINGMKVFKHSSFALLRVLGTDGAQKGFVGRSGRALRNGRSFSAFDREGAAPAAMCRPARFRCDLTDCGLLEQPRERGLCG